MSGRFTLHPIGIFAPRRFPEARLPKGNHGRVLVGKALVRWYWMLDVRCWQLAFCLVTWGCCSKNIVLLLFCQSGR